MSSVALQQSHSQKQGLAAKARQGIAILQANTTELRSQLHQALMLNPVLELDFPIAEGEFSSSSEDSDWNAVEDMRELAILEHGGRNRDAELRHQYWLDSLVASQSLQEILSLELRNNAISPELQAVVIYLIGDLNDSGFLSTSLEESATHTGHTLELLEEGKDWLQRLAPAGIGAVDLRESLLIQLERRYLQDEIAYDIVRDYLTLLAEGKLRELATLLKVSEEAIIEAKNQITSLDPSPGANYGGVQNLTVLPDLSFAQNEAGEWEVSVVEEFLPKLAISSYYKGVMSKGEDKPLRDYLKTQIREGRTLINALDQRKETILAIGQELLSAQSDFLEKGIGALKPLRMEQIANRLGVHASTISRAVNGKYIQTPFGVMELRAFFISGIVSQAEGEVSPEYVKAQILSRIGAEDPGTPLSDTALEESLRSDGILISRRTVAKYRKELGIASSRSRGKL